MILQKVTLRIEAWAAKFQFMRHLIFSLILGLALVACGPDASIQSKRQSSGGHGPAWFEVTVTSTSGNHEFHVEIADDAPEQRRGLMYRRTLAEDAGMLFLYEAEEPLSYWMRNTYVSLDIIYIDQTGHIVSIAKDTTPLSERSIPSLGPAIAVLEINAGLSDQLGFAAGDTVHHPFFGN